MILVGAAGAGRLIGTRLRSFGVPPTGATVIAGAAPPRAVPRCRTTNRRAMMLTIRVRTNSTSPAANSADRCSGVAAASPNSFAITAASE